MSTAGSTSSVPSPAGDHHHQIHRDDQRDHRGEPADHRAQRHHRQAGDAGERHHRDADRAEGHRRGVGDQADARGIERGKAEAGEHRAGDRDRCAETGRPLDEGAERKGDEQGLQPAIAGQPSDRVLDDFELAGVHREAIQHDRREHDPRDREQAVGRAGHRRHQGEPHRHPIGDRAQERRRCRVPSAPPSTPACGGRRA